MTLPFTDHHIQDKIIAALVNGPKRFSELVPDGMEHSLFMYHMKKLLKEGLVAKDGQTYELTAEGARQYNARYRMVRPLRQPSVLIQFVVTQNDAVLLSRRTTALNKSLNEYMLPGGNHFFLSPSRSSANANAKNRGLKAGEFLFSVETISKDREFHGLIDVYEATVRSNELKKTHDYELVWLPVNTVKAMSFSQAGSAPFIVAHYYQRDATVKRLTNFL